MRTLEDAISLIEGKVSGRYMETFPDSQLRKDPNNVIEFLKFNFETLEKTKNIDVKINAFENVLDIVLDNHEIPDEWKIGKMVNYFDYCRNKKEEHRLIKWPGDARDCIYCCNDIINRLAENDKNEDSLSISDLNDKYVGKWLYFNGDEDGCQWIYVKNIHREGSTPEICVDGVMIEFNGQDFKFEVYQLDNFNFANCYYFGSNGEDDENYAGYTLCSSLDKALMSNPIDTSLKSHVITHKDVVTNILALFSWEFEHGYGTCINPISEIFDDLVRYESNR